MLKILFLIPPRKQGSWVIREHKEGGYDIPHIPHLAPSILGLVKKEMEDVSFKVFDTQLHDSGFASIKQEIDLFHPDIILAQMGSYTISHDKKYMEFEYPTICITPESFDPIEIISCYDVQAKYFVKTEIENTILDGLKEFQVSRKIHESPGFIIREGRRLIDTGDNKPYDLSKLPMPAYDLFEVDKYFELQEAEIGFRCVFLYTARGCIFRCAYCITPEEKGMRSKTVPQIIEEIAYFYHNHTCRNFNFCDSTFSFDKERAKKICEEIIDNKLDIHFIINDSVNTVNDELLGVLKRAGCKLIRFGVETGDEAILWNMSKTIAPEKIREVFENAKQHSIATDAFLMVGFPGETHESIKSTYNLVSQIAPDRFTVSILFPKPFSKLYCELKEKGLLLENDWSEYITPRKLLFEHDTYRSIDEIFAAKWWLVKKLTRKLAIKRFVRSDKKPYDVFALLVSYLKTFHILNTFVLFICSQSHLIRRLIFSLSDYDRMYNFSSNH